MSIMSAAADRELRAEGYAAVPIETVWSTLTDLSRMPGWSPELVRMVPLKPGGLRPGQWYLGINKRGLVVWPTRNVVVSVKAPKLLVWDTRSSGARWVWELTSEGEGTRIVHRRPVPQRLTRLSQIFAPAFLGGSPEHADELGVGMAATVEGLARASEA